MIGKRRLIIIITVLALLLIVGAVGITVAIASSDARGTISDNRQAVIDATTTLNSKLADNSLSNTDKILSIDEYSSSLSSYHDAICGPQREQFYSYLLPERDKCERVRESVDKLKGTVSLIYSFMKQQSELAGAIPPPTELSLQQSYESWSQATVKVEEIEVITQLQTQKTTLATALSAYRDTWKSLIDADAAQDEAAFVAAQESLLGAYETLKGAASGLGEPLAGLINDFKTNFDAFVDQTS